MTDYTTIRVTAAAKEQAEESKREDETWNEYLLRCSDNPPEVREYVPADAVGGGTGDDLQAETADILARLDDLETQLPRKVADTLQR